MRGIGHGKLGVKTHPPYPTPWLCSRGLGYYMSTIFLQLRDVPFVGSIVVVVVYFVKSSGAGYLFCATSVL